MWTVAALGELTVHVSRLRLTVSGCFHHIKHVNSHNGCGHLDSTINTDSLLLGSITCIALDAGCCFRQSSMVVDPCVRVSVCWSHS